MSTDEKAKTPAKVDDADAQALAKLTIELHSVQENTPEAKFNETHIRGKDGRRIKLDNKRQAKDYIKKQGIKPNK